MDQVVYIPQDIEYEGKQFLLEKGYKVKIGSGFAKATMMKEIADCHAVLTRSNAIINDEIIRAGKNIKIIAKYGVGLDNIDIESATKRGIYVTNTPKANANAVAEHVMAFILALSKKIPMMDKELRKGNFTVRNSIFSEDLEDKILGIVGIGKIGKLVAKKARDGFGMKIIGYDPYIVTEVPGIEKIDYMEGVFKNADFVSLHLPLSNATKRMIGESEFNWMKSSAYFINVSRGEIVDERALTNVLKKKRIAGAAIDVFEVEPPEMDNPLFQLSNIIVTPHSAALSKQGSIRMSVHAAMEIDKVLRGLEPDWQVNEVRKTSNQ